MKSMTWKTVLLGTVLGIGVSAYAHAQTIRFAHVDPADWQSSKKGAAAEMFKSVVEGRTDFDVKLYPAGSLGDEDELVQQAMDGTTQVVMVSGAMSKICPAAGVLDIPYMFNSAVTAWRVLDGEFGEQLAQHCLEQTGLRTLGYGETGFRNFTNDTREIKTPADMQGLKFRVQDIPLYVKMVEGLGGEPTPIAWSELPTALSTGVVDGQENPIGTIYNNNLHELQDYMVLDRHIYGTDFILINDQFFQSLSKADRQSIEQAGIIAGNMGRSIQEFTSAKGLTAVKEAGMNVYSPTSEDFDKFRQAAQPPVIEWLKKDLGDEAAWIQRLQDAVASVDD